METSVNKNSLEEAQEYLDRLKEVFFHENQRERWNGLVKALTDMAAGKIEEPSFIEELKRVFEGHADLLEEFKSFLSDEFQSIFVSCEITAFNSRLQTSIDFLNKVRQRFANNLDVYRSFLETISMQGMDENQVLDVYKKIFHLFKGHADLICDFEEEFLNDRSQKLLKKIKNFRISEIQVQLSKVRAAIEEVEHLYWHVDVELNGSASIILKEELVRDLKTLYDYENQDFEVMIKKMRKNPRAVRQQIEDRLIAEEENDTMLLKFSPGRCSDEYQNLKLKTRRQRRKLKQQH